MPRSIAKEVEELYRDAELLRKETHDKWKSVLGSTLTVPGLDQDYLIRKMGLLMDIAFFIEKYSMEIQGKPLQWNVEEIRAFRELIECVKNMMS